MYGEVNKFDDVASAAAADFRVSLTLVMSAYIYMSLCSVGIKLNQFSQDLDLKSS